MKPLLLGGPGSVRVRGSRLFQLGMMGRGRVKVTHGVGHSLSEFQCLRSDKPWDWVLKGLIGIWLSGIITGVK